MTGWGRRACLLPLTGLAAAISLLFALESGLNEDPRAGASAAIAGTAPRPAACRALLPLAARATVAVLPGPVREAVAAMAPPAAVVLYGWVALFLLVFALAAEPFFRAVTGLGSGWTLLVPFAALAGLPPLFLHSRYYDLPMVALSTLCLLFMVKRRWAAYGVTLAAAAMNKETAVLFPLAFALHFGRRDRMESRRFWPLLLGQAAVVVLIRWGLAAAYADRPGGMVEALRWDLLSPLLRAYRMDTAVAWTAILLAAAFDWSEKPALLKAVLAAALPLYAASAVLGSPSGIRLACEIYPVALVLVLYPFLKRLGRGATAGDPEPA